MNFIKKLPQLVTFIMIISVITVVSYMPVATIPNVSADECNSIATGNNAYQSTLVGTKLYTNNRDSSTVTIIDTTTDTLIGSIDMPGPLFSTLVGTKLYVSSYSTDSIRVIDTTTDILEPSTISTGDYPIFSIASGSMLYVLNREGNNVSVIDTGTDSLVTLLPVGDTPVHAVLVGTNLYVINQNDDTISIINTNTNTVTDTISFQEASGINYATLVDINLLYVTSSFAGNLYILNTDSNTITGSLGPGAASASKLVDGYLYLLIPTDGTVVVIDTSTDTIIGEPIPVGTYPTSMTSSNGKLYVNNIGDSSVSVIDTESKTKITDITVRANPSYSVVSGNKLYVNNSGDASVSVIDTTTDSVISVPCSGVPELVNGTASLITQTSATVSGEITDTGNLPILARYFIVLKAVDFNEGNPEYGNLIFSTPEYGSFGLGQFSAPISSLVCGTDYLFLSAGDMQVVKVLLLTQ